MPCLGPTDEQLRELDHLEGRMHGRQDFEAVLCGFFTELEDRGSPWSEGRSLLEDMLEWVVDWEEVGVPKERVQNWWDEHKAKDVTRRAQEAAERERLRLVESARTKLTPEELAALGGS